MGFRIPTFIYGFGFALSFVSSPVFSEKGNNDLFKTLEGVSDQEEARSIIHQYFGVDNTALTLSESQSRQLTEIVGLKSSSDLAALSPGASRAILESLGVHPEVIASLFELYDWNYIDHIESLKNSPNFWQRLLSRHARLDPKTKFSIHVVILGLGSPVLSYYSYLLLPLLRPQLLSLIILASGMSASATYLFVQWAQAKDLPLRENTTSIINIISERRAYPKPLDFRTPSDAMLALLRACYRNSAQRLNPALKR